MQILARSEPGKPRFVLACRRTAEAWQQSVDSGKAYQVEHRVRMADGEYRWHLSRGVPVRDEAGQISRWFGTATDIHNQKPAEEQLRFYAEKLKASNRELQAFAYVASHDLQEPLRKIESFGDLLVASVGFVQIERKTLKFANLNFYEQTAKPIE